MSTSSLAASAALAVATLFLAAAPAPLMAMPTVHVVANWQIQVAPGDVTVGRHQVTIPRPVKLAVAPAVFHVQDEKYDHLPLFNDQAAPWTRERRFGRALTMIIACPNAIRWSSPAGATP